MSQICFVRHAYDALRAKSMPLKVILSSMTLIHFSHKEGTGKEAKPVPSTMIPRQSGGEPPRQLQPFPGFVFARVFLADYHGSALGRAPDTEASVADGYRLSSLIVGLGAYLPGLLGNW